jgi:hypothetical protein
MTDSRERLEAALREVNHLQHSMAIEGCLTVSAAYGRTGCFCASRGACLR